MVNHILHRDPNAKTWLEIGSFNGESATLLLGFPQLVHITLVEQSQEKCKYLEAKFSKPIAAHRLTVINATSQQFVKAVPNCYAVDVVYIDADHSYESVSSDIRALAPLCVGTFVCGHDYHTGFPGVVRAVDEFRAFKQTNLRTFSDSSWCVRLR